RRQGSGQRLVMGNIAGVAGIFLAAHQRQPQRMAEDAELQPAQADGQVQAGEQQQRNEEERTPDERADLVQDGLKLLHRCGSPAWTGCRADAATACTLTTSRPAGYPPRLAYLPPTKAP